MNWLAVKVALCDSIGVTMHCGPIYSDSNMDCEDHNLNDS